MSIHIYAIVSSKPLHTIAVVYFQVIYSGATLIPVSLGFRQAGINREIRQTYFSKVHTIR